MQQNQTVVTEIDVSSPRGTVWDRVSDIGLLRRACASVFGVGVVSKGSASPYDASAVSLLNAQMIPYDVLLTGEKCSVALRLYETGEESSKLLIAAAYDLEAALKPNRQQLENLAFLLKSQCEAPEQKATVYRAPKTETEEIEPVSPPQRDRAPASPPRQAQPVRKRKNGSGKIIVRIAPILMGVLIVAAVAMGTLFWSDIRNLLVPYKPPTADSGTVGYSELVTLQNMLTIKTGDSEKAIAKTLGTSGIHGDHGNSIYFGGAAMSDGNYSIRISIDYENGIAKKITYLNLEQSRKVGSLASASFAITPDMTVSVMEETIGVPASMVRRYTSDSGEMMEVHFGHTDPFGNFSPAWRGEYVATVNTTNTTVSAAFWPTYDGADPLMIEKLQGHPVAIQYSDYDQFLYDKYIFERSLYMLNRFSFGDAQAIFGPMELFSTDGGVALYRQESPEILETTGFPAYRMTYGFDSRSQFVMSAYSNMRLFEKAGMLAESDYASITRGMSYSEVRGLMRILPSAVMVNEHYFSLCYGMRLESDIFEDQFELIVSFDIDNNYVQAIYTNSGS